MTYIDTALDIELDTAFKAVTGMGGIVEIFIVTSEAEPSLCVACARSLFKVAEGGAGIVLDMIRVRARRGEGGAKIDGFRGEDGHRGGVLGGCDLEDERECDLDETHELGVLDGDGSYGRGIT